MADNRKYYYLKLKESYFDEDAIVLLESMQDGMLYSNILLKLYLKSLKNGESSSLPKISLHRTDDSHNHPPASRHSGEGFADFYETGACRTVAERGFIHEQH